MAFPRRAILPCFLSFVTGLGVLVAIGYVRQHAGTGETGFALAFAVVVWAIWLLGFVRACRFLSEYGREEAALPRPAAGANAQAQQTSARLTALAQTINQGQNLPVPDMPDTPLLLRRLQEVTRAIRRGATPSTDNLAESEERKLSGPERELRAYMDIALNIGIAGTFVAILITLGRPQGLTAETLLAHVGPGMASGLAAVIANVGLRLCHRAVQDEQDELAQRIDDTVADSFLAHLDRTVLSPEDRFAAAAARSLTAQGENTQKLLLEQSSRFEKSLEQYAGRTSSLLTQQLQQPIQQIADYAGQFAAHTGALAKHSGTWAETADAVKAAHIWFLQAQIDAQAAHETRLTALFTQFRASLDAFLDTARQSDREAMQETQEFTHRLLQAHTQALAEMTENLRTQFAAIQSEQEAAHHRMTRLALESLGSVVESRLSAVEERVAAALTLLENRLPETLRAGVRDGLTETVSLIETVREQAGHLAHAIQQISGNADRQLQAYDRWNDRALSVQGRLEEVVKDGQAAQSALLANWKSDAGQTLESVRAAFESTAREAQSGSAGLATTLDALAATLQSLGAVAQGLQTGIAAMPPLVVETRTALTEIAPALRDTGTACREIGATFHALNESIAGLLATAQTAQASAQRQSQEAARELQILAQAVGGAVTKMDQAADAFAVVASRTAHAANNHDLSDHALPAPPHQTVAGGRGQ